MAVGFPLQSLTRVNSNWNLYFCSIVSLRGGCKQKRLQCQPGSAAAESAHIKKNYIFAVL